MADTISPDDMSNDTIYRLFNAAYMQPELCGEGGEYVRVNGPSGESIYIAVDGEKQLLRFMIMYRLKGNRNRVEELELVNQLNDCVVLARFSLPHDDDDLLIVDYFLAYEEGVLAMQIINSFQWLDQVTIGAISNLDKLDMIE